MPIDQCTHTTYVDDYDPPKKSKKSREEEEVQDNNSREEEVKDMSRYLLISKVVVELNLWTYRRSMKTLRVCNFDLLFI